MVPVVVGVGGTLRSGSALVGRRTARLAGVVAGLGMFLVSTIAIVATHGGPSVQGQSIAYAVSDGLANLTSLDLMLIPLATATIGWAAATATFRIRYVDLARADHDSMNTPMGQTSCPKETGAETWTPTRRTAVAAAVVLAAAFFFLARIDRAALSWAGEIVTVTEPPEMRSLLRGSEPKPRVGWSAPQDRTAIPEQDRTPDRTRSPCPSPVDPA